MIVDDEPLAIDVISGYVSRVPQLELIVTCSDAMEALQALNQNSIDLIFLDIEMPELNGIDFLKSLSRPPKVILTTAYREYAIESYEVDVVDYLLKPISFNRFFKSISKFLKSNSPVLNIQQSNISAKPNSDHSGSIYVYSDKKNIKVFFNEILYVESIKDYVRIHCTEQNIVSKATITKYENLLPDEFVRIHRSYIVNTQKITAFTHHDIEIGQKELPIGASYKRAVISKLKEE